jgi:uncharacterized membrane protein YqgA involved in biofilm formation
MPVGILTDVFVTLAGGILGCILGSRISDRWKNMLNDLLGMSALVLGITLVVKVHSLSAAILALLCGGMIGEAVGLEDLVNRAAAAVTRKIAGGANSDPAYLAAVSAALILFCFGGTGWYGALNEGMTGDGSVLITKSILDCVTACIFAAIHGRLIPLLSIPEFCVLMTLFMISGAVSPWITPTMTADFSAVGGIITITAGLRLTKIKTDIKVLNLLPALILAFFISAAWTGLLG